MDEKKVLMDEDKSIIEKNRKSKKKGKPKGLPKSGGRAPGTPNKKTIFLNHILHESGFDFGHELLSVLRESTLQERISLLKEILPYIAPRLNPKDISEEPTNSQPADILSIVNNGK